MNLDFVNLDRHIAAGTLVRQKWTDTHEGRERACLLAALVPECGEAESADACPAELLPAWFASLVPEWDDRGSEAAWPAMVQRFAGVVRRFAALPAEVQERLRYAWLGICVREAVSHTQEPCVVIACRSVIGLCDRAAAGDAPTPDEWAAARAAAAEAAAEAAWAAARAADAAARAAARAAGAAAWAAARADAAADAAAWAAAAAAVAAAWDRMTAAFFDAVEAASRGNER